MQALVRLFTVIGIFVFSTAIHANEQDHAKIKEVIKKELGSEPTSIVASPIKGIYEVTVPPRVFYVSADARYLFLGNLIDLETKSSLTQAKTAAARAAVITQMTKDELIVFAPEKTKYTISVFTDIDCGYCRKLHSEIAKYNKLGIKVQYLAFPRAGVGSRSFRKAEAVWCSKDKAKALTTAKNGGEVPFKECDNPVKKHMQLGSELGVSGTPAMLLENGQIYPGYVPADKLIKVLEEVKAQMSK